MDTGGYTTSNIKIDDDTAHTKYSQSYSREVVDTYGSYAPPLPVEVNLSRTNRRPVLILQKAKGLEQLRVWGLRKR